MAVYVLANVLAEHLAYLADAPRTRLFKEALNRTISQGDNVVDLGCGSGLLGFLALKAGADHVWGIDNSPALSIARETSERAGWSERYTCISEISFRAHISRRADVIVCDHVGYFGLDYGLIEILSDARSRFLKTDGSMIPRAVRLCVAGVSSSRCREKVDAPNALHVLNEFHWLRSLCINSKHVYDFDQTEICTRPVPLESIDLAANHPETFIFDASISIDQDCILDGLAGWFEAELADNLWMTNSPLEPDRINRPQVFLGIDQPLSVKAGDMVPVRLTLRHDSGLIGWSVVDPETRQRQKHSNLATIMLNLESKKRGRGHVPTLTTTGHARSVVMRYIDGARTSEEIEEAVLRDNPDLLPTEKEIRRFVRNELMWNAG